MRSEKSWGEGLMIYMKSNFPCLPRLRSEDSVDSISVVPTQSTFSRSSVRKFMDAAGVNAGFGVTVENVEPERVMRYSLLHDGAVLKYREVLELWQNNREFRGYFSSLLSRSPFSAFRWETPAVTSSTIDQAFQFVLLNSPGFSTRSTDRKAFEDYFTSDDTDGGIVSFMSLGGDARLIVPSPRTENKAYGHLAAFLRQAPPSQVDAIWQVISTAVKSQVGKKPVWLNTAGGGVAWLHVRLDSRPKYYGYTPYKTPQ